MKTLALVVPCYNEARRLDVDAFLQAVEKYRWLSFVFVDDGSRDGTFEMLEHLARLSPAFAVRHLQMNGGKAAAVRTGVEYLLKNSYADLIGFWDADLATPLSELPAFARAFEEDPELLAAIGSRWPHLGAELKRRKDRGAVAWVIKAFIRARLGVEVWDTQCGAKVFTRAAAVELFREEFRTRWLFDVELLSRLGKRRLAKRVRELPLECWRDIPGSKLSMVSAPGILKEMLRLLSVQVL